MKYTAKSKQNLDGVQTLTGDPLVTYQIVGKDGSKKIKRPKKRS